MDAPTLHDLKNSLTVIRCQAQMMQRRLRLASAPDNDTKRASLDAITRIVFRLNYTIDTLSTDDQEDVPSPE
jgi:nitrogen fixation/metabolism regulation signal transduction histidine kinase